MRIMPYMLEKYGFTEGCEGVATNSRLVFKAHEIILKRVESESWRPHAKIRMILELACSNDIAMRLNAWADVIFILRNRKRWNIQKCWIMDAATMAVKVLQRLRPTRSRLHPVDDAGLSPDVDMGLILNKAGVRCLLSIQATDTIGGDSKRGQGVAHEEHESLDHSLATGGMGRRHGVAT